MASMPDMSELVRLLGKFSSDMMKSISEIRQEYVAAKEAKEAEEREKNPEADKPKNPEDARKRHEDDQDR